jgi:hypothetical protein
VIDKEANKFVLAVVNAWDTGPVRGRFLGLYRDWFPQPEETARHRSSGKVVTGEHVRVAWDDRDLEELRTYYKETREKWWCFLISGKLPSEEGPDRHFGYEVVILRHKLRFIWHLALSGEEGALDEAKLRAQRIATRSWNVKQSCVADRPHWSVLQRDVSWWLSDQVARLRICGNPECMTRETYFFRDARRKDYCCTPCVGHAHYLRAEGYQIPLAAVKVVDPVRSKAAKGAWAARQKQRAAGLLPN